MRFVIQPHRPVSVLIFVLADVGCTRSVQNSINGAHGMSLQMHPMERIPRCVHIAPLYLMGK